MLASTDLSSTLYNSKISDFDVKNPRNDIKKVEENIFRSEILILNNLFCDMLNHIQNAMNTRTNNFAGNILYKIHRYQNACSLHVHRYYCSVCGSLSIVTYFLALSHAGQGTQKQRGYHRGDVLQWHDKGYISVDEDAT